MNYWLFLFQLNLVYSLSKYQLKIINNIIIHPKTEPILRDKINKILVDSYKNWSLKKAYDFKKLHYYKCKHIPLHELQLYSFYGLCKGVKNYKGIKNETNQTSHSAYFTYYVNFYITGCLLRGMTELQTLSIYYPTYIKLKKRVNGQKLMSSINFVGENEWLFDKTSDKKVPYIHEESSQIWEKINNMGPIHQKIFKYMYDDYFKKIRTNKKVAELMSCSEETIRIKMKQIIMNLRNQ